VANWIALGGKLALIYMPATDIDSGCMQLSYGTDLTEEIQECPSDQRD
jgi:hypothetical protein